MQEMRVRKGGWGGGGGHFVASDEFVHNVHRTLSRRVGAAAAFGLSFERRCHKLGQSGFSGFFCRLTSCTCDRAAVDMHNGWRCGGRGRTALPLRVTALLRGQSDGVPFEQGRREVVAVAHLLRDGQLRVVQIEGDCGYRGDWKHGAVGGCAGVAKGAGARAGARPQHGARSAQLCADQGQHTGTYL